MINTSQRELCQYFLPSIPQDTLIDKIFNFFSETTYPFYRYNLNYFLPREVTYILFPTDSKYLCLNIEYFLGTKHYYFCECTSSLFMRFVKIDDGTNKMDASVLRHDFGSLIAVLTVCNYSINICCFKTKFLSDDFLETTNHITKSM